jgi:hypothetical protein
MKSVQAVVIGALVLGLGGAGVAPAGQKKEPEVTEKEFRQANFLLMEDPLGKNAREHAKTVLVFTMQTPKAEVVLGKEELKWLGDKEDKRSTLLFAAYTAGNTLSQLDSGVKRNDPYPGLLQLFRVYRVLHERDKNYRIDEVERLLKLHQEGRLLQQLAQKEKKAEEKKP